MPNYRVLRCDIKAKIYSDKQCTKCMGSYMPNVVFNGKKKWDGLIKIKSGVWQGYYTRKYFNGYQVLKRTDKPIGMYKPSGSKDELRHDKKWEKVVSKELIRQESTKG